MGALEVFKKQGGLALLKQYWKCNAFCYSICQFLLTGKSRIGLEYLRQGVTIKTHQSIEKKILKKIIHLDEEVTKSSYVKKDSSNIIWVSWMQGIDKAPALVQRCYRSLQKNLKDREIVLITSENLKNYTDIPSWVLEKYEKGLITHTHFSDLLRLELLCKHGGTWIDSTVFCSGGNIPYYMLDSDLFMFQVLKPGLDGRFISLSSWFLTAKPNNKILLMTRALLWDYWKNNNALLDYFLLHHYISIVADYYKSDWNMMVQFPNSIPHIIQLMQFENFNKEKWDAVTSICPFHKLTYKINDEDTKKEGTYYKHIMES